MAVEGARRGWCPTAASPEKPCRRDARQDYEQEALRQGHIAVNSILRDWIEGQVTVIECGILSFEAVFFSHMIIANGQTMLEHVVELLPKPEDKVVALGR